MASIEIGGYDLSHYFPWIHDETHLGVSARVRPPSFWSTFTASRMIAAVVGMPFESFLLPFVFFPGVVFFLAGRHDSWWVADLTLDPRFLRTGLDL
jgi:hypothetical protein